MTDINRKCFLAGLGAAIAGISLGGSSNEQLETHEDLGNAALDFGLTELQIRVDKHLTKNKCLEYGEPYRLIVHFLDSSSGICSKSAYMGGEEWTNTDEVMTFFEYIKKGPLKSRVGEQLRNGKPITISIEVYQWSGKYILKYLAGKTIAI